MNLRADVPMIAIMGALGWGAGLLFSPGAGWTAISFVIGIGLGLLMAGAGVRPLVGPVIIGGGILGAWIGREVVRALCLPGSCTSIELGGAIFSGIGSTIGIGLVVALVVRSFDEYGQGQSPD